jgi:hypothetical protein
MSQPIEHKLVSRIYGQGRGWAFSPKDFGGIGQRSNIDVALYRLLAKGTIRRVLRGIYDYPKQSTKLGRTLSPDLDQVARALARKSGWRIQATGPAALNLLGLSTQIAGRMAYLSDGPTRTYRIEGRELTFEHTVLKEAGFRYKESSLLVQALKTLGPKRIAPETIRRLRTVIARDLRPKVLKDTRTAPSWIRNAILKVCEETT